MPMTSQNPYSRDRFSRDSYRGKYAQDNNHYNNAWSAYQRSAHPNALNQQSWANAEDHSDTKNQATSFLSQQVPEIDETEGTRSSDTTNTSFNNSNVDEKNNEENIPFTQASYDLTSNTTESNSENAGFESINAKKNPGNASPTFRKAPQYKKTTQNKRRRSSKKVAAILVALVVIGGSITGGIAYAYNAPITVTINGEQTSIQGDERSPEGLVENGIVSVKPGNYIAVDNSVIREGEGYPCTAKINGNDVPDLETRLNNGDTIDITDGSNIMEPYTDSAPQPAPCSVEETGVGAVHLYVGEGVSGEKIIRTGSESGKTTEIVTKEPSTIQLAKYNVDTHGDKVIALTFDDGPWDSSTAAILDVLKENNAKATFFTVGERIKGHEDLIKRMKDEGHEIATHSYDHANGSGKGVSMDLMSTKERQDEVTKGLQAITDAGCTPSKTFRSPGGNFSTDTARDVQGLISSEIGWNIDTGDWKRPGANTIAARIEMAQPGYILLMHDGGGDRSQTVEALKEALPKLAEQGYEFVTVDELIERYPYAS